MSKGKFVRPRHGAVARILGALNKRFLAQAQCYFGGGTRIVLALKEYRESADIGFLCASREGYRLLRSTVSPRSLGLIASSSISLARDVVADRYGIRTVIDVGDEKIKLEIINEGRIDLSGEVDPDLRVACLDASSCFAEKLLANDDRWNDDVFLGRDIIDLAYMIEGWGVVPFIDGARRAYAAYGESVEVAARRAARKLLDKADYRQKCVQGLRVADVDTLMTGLKRIASRRWSCRPDPGKP